VGPTILKFASYNIHSCVGRDGRYDPERISEVINQIQADAVGLQEVDAGYGKGSDLDLLARLSRDTGMDGISGATRLSPRGDFGNALLARWPIETVRLKSIGLPGREPRGVIDAGLDMGGVKIRMVVTHFGLRASERASQARELIRMTETIQESFLVVAGDFNEWARRGKALRRLNRFFGPSWPVRTFPSRLPLFSLDRIWVKPSGSVTQVHAHRSGLSRVASDHLPVVAQVSLDGVVRG
jgi:endonuclease/exonuclease/phosphatase family metal-dependent hydrolase